MAGEVEVRSQLKVGTRGERPAVGAEGRSGSFVRILGLSWLLLFGPTLLDLCLSGPERVFGWIAPDTFYYLVYARETLAAGMFSYDGVHWSNSFHPLWMLPLVLVQAVQPYRGTAVDLYVLVVICACLQGGALYLWARVFQRPDGSLTSWFLALPVGLYALLACGFTLRLTTEELRASNPWQGCEPVYGTAWSYMNGMESSMALLSFAAVAYGFCTLRPSQNRRHALTLGALLAALTFSRLDHCFIAAPIWAMVALRERIWTERRALYNWLYTSAAFIGPLLGYVIVNRLVFGSALPISGRLKSSFPFVGTDGFNILAQLLNDLVGGPRIAIWIIWRVLQSAVPVCFALLAPFVLLRVRLRRGAWIVSWAGRSDLHALLAAVAVGVCLLATYNFLFVSPWATGNWYFPASTLFVTLIFLAGVERVDRCLRARWSPRRWQAALSVVLQVLLFVGSVAFFFRLHRRLDYNNRYAEFYFRERDKVRGAFRGKEPRLLSMDDGIVGWVTGFQTMTATGLGLDPEAAARYRAGALLDVAEERGYNCLTSLAYIDYAPVRAKPPRIEEWREAVKGFGDLSGRALHIAYASESLNFGIVCFGPKK